MVAPFHIAGSMIAAEAAMRGEPNSVVSQFASKPSGETLELSGSVLPPKLGDGQRRTERRGELLAGELHRERAGAAQADDRT